MQRSRNIQQERITISLKCGKCEHKRFCQYNKTPSEETTMIPTTQYKKDTIIHNEFFNELMQFFVKISGFEIHISTLIIMKFSELMRKYENEKGKTYINNLVYDIRQALQSNEAIQEYKTLKLEANIHINEILKTCKIEYYQRHKTKSINTAKRILSFLGGMNYTRETTETIEIKPIIKQAKYNTETETFSIIMNEAMLPNFHADYIRGFKQVSFMEQAELKGKHAKILYFLLKPFEDKGYATFNIFEFLTNTGTKETKELQRVVLKPAIAELKEKIYKDIKWEYTRESESLFILKRKIIK